MDIGECYLILGLEEGAGEEEIKSAYRKLAKQYHPDKTQGDEFLGNMFKKIHTAYKILSNASGYDESFNSKSSAPVYKGSPTLTQWILDYQQVQLRISEERNRLDSIRYIQKIKYLSASNLFKVVAVLVLIVFFFYPERLKSNSGQSLQGSENRWVLKNQVNLYQKPNVKAKVLSSLKPGDKLDSIGETKYYYKVRLDSGMMKISGYILKDKMDK